MAVPLLRHMSDLEIPRIIRLAPNLHAAAFFLMKLLPARFIMERALERGEMTDRSHVCETSSGTFGLALAMLTASTGNQLTIVSDWALDAKLQRRLVELGAEVEIVAKADSDGGLQKARLDRLQTILNQDAQTFWPRQYDNPDNPRSYSEVAAKLVERIGEIDCLVGTVGSGGSLCGTARYLRLICPNLMVIGIDTMNSVLFGQPDAARLIRGLGGSVVPSNIDHSQIDEVHWLTAAEIFNATRELHRRSGLFMGPTSGAAYRVASWWTAQNPGRSVAVLMPDEGHRYVDTAYDDDWLDATTPDWRDKPPLHPEVAVDPSGLFRRWTRLPWARRLRSEVVQQGEASIAVTGKHTCGLDKV